MATYLDIYIARRIVNYRSLGYSAIVYTMFGLMRDLREEATTDALRVFLRTRLDDMSEQLTEAAFMQFRRHQQNQSFVFNLLARLSYFVERETARQRASTSTSIGRRRTGTTSSTSGQRR